MPKERTFLDVYDEGQEQEEPFKFTPVQEAVYQAAKARESPQGQYDKIMDLIHKDDHLPSVPELFVNDLEVQAGRRKPCPACRGADNLRAGVHNKLGPWTCAMCRGRGTVEV